MKRPTLEETIIDLKRQRCDYARRIELGESMLQPSVEFIDNMLAQLLPGYAPPGGCGCGDK